MDLKDILTSGYIHQIEKEYKLSRMIASEITYIICLYFTYFTTFELHAIGYNVRGEWGNGTNRTLITQITKIKTFKKQIKNVICGTYNIFILFNDNQHYECSGMNDCGELGIGRIFDQRTFLLNNNINVEKIFTGPNVARNTFAIGESKKLYACGMTFNMNCKKLMNQKWIEIETVETITKVSTAEHYTIFLGVSGKIYTAGEVLFGSLGLGENINKTEKITQIQTKTTFNNICCGKSHTLAIDTSQSVYSFGYGIRGQLGHGNNTMQNNKYSPEIIQYFQINKIKAIQISCGWSHSMVLSHAKNVYCFGDNEYYQCGNNNNNKIYTPEINKTLKSQKVLNIKCGAQCNVINTDQNDFYLWGRNDKNQCLYELNPNESEIPKCVKMPLLFNPNHFSNDKRIIDIYVGIDSTLLLIGSN